MNTSPDDTESVRSLPQLTAEQRRQICEEEKRRVERTARLSEPVYLGDGRSPKELNEYGHAVLRRNPQAAQFYEAEFRETGAASGNGIGVIGAKVQEATREADHAYRKFGENSPQYQDARDKQKRWLDLSEEMGLTEIQNKLDEEVRWTKRASEWLSENAKFLTIAYLLGCLLIYFGMTFAGWHFLVTGEWELEPNPHLFQSLVEAAVTLIRPFIAVLLNFWLVLLLGGAVYGGAGLIKFFKRVIKRQ